MLSRSFSWLFIVAIAAMGCAARAPLPRMSSLEMRYAQTRAYDSGDPDLVLRAVLQALQDSGFQLKSAEYELGLLVAVAETTSGKDPGVLVKSLFGFVGFRDLLPGRTTRIVEVTGTTTPMGEQTRVRLSAQLRIIDKKGRIREARPINELVFYQDLFARIDKALFLEREGIP